MTAIHYTRCQGIIYHQDTVWQRCPKAEECQRYIRRHDDEAGVVVNRLCSTVEFEHFIPNGR